MKYLGLLVFLVEVCCCVCCPDGWVSHNTKCYHFSRDTETWADSMSMCQFMKGQLVEIEDAGENTYLESQAKLRGSTYWIALSDVEEEGTWVWMNSGKHVTSETFTDWAPGQPNNSNNHQDCGMLLASLDSHWNDDQCHNRNHYICEKGDSVQVIG